MLAVVGDYRAYDGGTCGLPLHSGYTPACLTPRVGRRAQAFLRSSFARGMYHRERQPTLANTLFKVSCTF
jgi:hypothetical protein